MHPSSFELLWLDHCWDITRICPGQSVEGTPPLGGTLVSLGVLIAVSGLHRVESGGGARKGTEDGGADQPDTDQAGQPAQRC